jgi:peroxiredoxin
MARHELDELEQEFGRLAEEIPDSATKQAISVLHGIVLEVWRTMQRERDPAVRAGLSLEELAGLYRMAPPMDDPAVSTPLQPGTPAPDFALADASGHPLRLGELRGRTVVLAFYPLDWSPGCSQQLDLYQQEIDEFRNRGVELLGISVDSLYSHGAWAALRGIAFPLLADFHPSGEVARRYSVWREQDGYSERALYVVDPGGVIRYSHVAPYLDHVPELDELLEAVDQVRAVAA